MENNWSKTIEELFKKVGYECSFDSSGGADKNCCVNAMSDIEGGFQDINPLVFVTMAEAIGDILSDRLPFNTANAVSYLFNLVGQIMETYAAQQIYFEGGPGRCYNNKYRNISNPFYKYNENDNEVGNIEIIEKEIKELNNNFKSFNSEIKNMKEEIEKINSILVKNELQ